MQAAGNVGGREGHDECAFRFGVALGGHLWAEEALCIPPVIPSGFDSDWVVPVAHLLREVWVYEYASSLS